ncbi:MAG: RagB/SusD family nutrient uptake outer membrane protein [Odoribacter sp.]|nr:RagB/SusD family nutrient uptake outer membrane protein [Odoribacter sp.]
MDDFLTEEPENKVSNNNYWKTEQDVESAVNGLHEEFRSCFSSSRVMLDRERALPFDYMASDWRNFNQNIFRNNYSISHAGIQWYFEYRVIAQANLILDNIERAKLPKERENYYKGQALVGRAYTYFYISRTWGGDAPLVLDSEDTGEKERTAWQVLADYAINDLKEAARILPRFSDLRDMNGNKVISKQIHSKGSAWAILSHVLAWKGALNDESELFKEAILYCDSVINSGDYVLANSIKELCDVVILGNSEEGILELDYRKEYGEFVSKGSCWAGCAQRYPVEPTSTIATRRTLMRFSNAQVEEWYEVGDERRDEYFYDFENLKQEPVATTMGAAYINKFRSPVLYTSGNNAGEVEGYENNEILIRLADIILLRAELKERTGDNDGAITDLNTIRQRAKASLFTSGDLKEAIFHEREKELFLEGINTRYFDIVRNGTFREKLEGDFKTLTDQDIKDGALFIPVGEAAFKNNTKTNQSPYWARNGYNI